jgi:hypothetical protein
MQNIDRGRCHCDLLAELPVSSVRGCDPAMSSNSFENSNDCELQKSAVVYGSMGWWALINLTSTGSFALL